MTPTTVTICASLWKVPSDRGVGCCKKASGEIRRDDRHRCGPGKGIALDERPSPARQDAKHREQAWCDLRATHALDDPGDRDVVRRVIGEELDVREQLRMPPPLGKFRLRDAVEDVRARMLDHRQPLRLGVRHRVKHERVRRREHNRIGAERDAEQQHDERRPPAARADATPGPAQILARRGKPRRAARRRRAAALTRPDRRERRERLPPVPASRRTGAVCRRPLFELFARVGERGVAIHATYANPSSALARRGGRPVISAPPARA